MNKFASAVCLLLLLVGLAFPAGPAQQPDPAAQPSSTPIAQMRDQIRVFESALNQSLAQAFEAPFGYLDRAHGAYLPGYGVVVTFEINLLPNLGPFAPEKPNPALEKAQRELQKRQREQARAVAQKMIANYGHTLPLGAGE